MPLLPTDLASAKKALLRRELRAVRNALGAEYRRNAEEKMISSLLSLPQFQNAKTVLTFYPVGSEPAILPIAEAALTLGKRVAFPLCHPEGPFMTFHSVDSLDALTNGSYGIPEPDGISPAVSELEDAICIVPALAFDENGYRLGYGKGYYDRFLSSFDGVSVGLVFSSLLLCDLPRDEYDEKVDIIITEKEMKPI